MLASNGTISGSSALLRTTTIGLALVIGVVAAGVGVSRSRKSVVAVAPPATYALRLDVELPLGDVILSAWNAGLVLADHDASDGRTIEYRRSYVPDDGCTWRSVETLVPEGDHYRYRFTEYPVSCPVGAKQEGWPSLLSGVVRVERMGERHVPTPLVADFSAADVEAAYAKTEAAVTLAVESLGVIEVLEE